MQNFLTNYSLERVRRWLLFTILAALPLERLPSFDIDVAGFPVTIRIAHLAAVMLILTAAPLLITQWQSLFKKPWIWLWLFNAVVLLTAFTGVGFTRSFLVFCYTFFMSILAWVISRIAKEEDLGLYAKIIFASATAVCFFGLFQFVGDMLNLPTYITGLREHYTKAVFGFPRIQSTSLEPLFFANYLLIPIGFAMAFFLYKNRSWFYLPLFLIVLTLTLSRGGFAAVVGMVLVTTVIAVMNRWYRRILVIHPTVVMSVLIALGLIVAATLINTQLADDTKIAIRRNLSSFTTQAVNTSSGISATTRSTMRAVALDIFEESPWLGIGAGNFGVYAHEHYSELISPSEVVNNELLELLAEVGIIGTFLFTLFAMNVLLDMRYIYTKTEDKTRRMWLTALFIVFVGFAIQYQTYSTLYVLHVWVMIGLALGILRQAQQPASARAKKLH